MLTADENTSPRRPRYILWILAAIGIFFLIAVSFTIGLITAGISILGGSGAGFGDGTKGKHEYITVQGQERFVAGVRLYGQINEGLADQVVDMLDETSKDKRVVGLLLDVNGPGGSVVASQEIYDAVKKLRETMPVVAYVREMAASGSYYSCASASKIVANRGSLVGSIGVVMQTMETSQLLAWLKLKPMTLKTGALKDSGSPLREWTNADKQYFQDLIDTTREQFLQDVLATRKLSKENIQLMSDGRVVVGNKALEIGLVDSLGSREDAINLVRNMANVNEKVDLYYLEKRKTFAEMFATALGEESRVSFKQLLAKDVIQSLTDQQPPLQIK